MSETKGLEHFVASWSTNPRKEKTYGSYYVKVVNDRSFLLKIEKTFSSPDVALLAMRVLKCNSVIINSWAEDELSVPLRGTMLWADRGLLLENKLFILNLTTLEHSFGEDVTELNIKHVPEIVGREEDTVCPLIIEMENGKKYLWDVLPYSNSPYITIQEYRSSSFPSKGLRRITRGTSEFVFTPTTADTVEEARANSYPQLADSDILISREVFLSPLKDEEKCLTEVTPEIIEKVKWAPNPEVGAIRKFNPSNIEPFKSFIYNRFLFKVLTKRSQVVWRAHSYSDLFRNFAEIYGVTEDGDIVIKTISNPKDIHPSLRNKRYKVLGTRENSRVVVFSFNLNPDGFMNIYFLSEDDTTTTDFIRFADYKDFTVSL